MEKELQSLNDRHEESELKFVAERTNLTNLQELLNVSTAVLNDAAILDQHKIDIAKIAAIITNLEKKIVKVSSNRSLQETEV